MRRRCVGDVLVHAARVMCMHVSCACTCACESESARVSRRPLVRLSCGPTVWALAGWDERPERVERPHKQGSACVRRVCSVCASCADRVCSVCAACVRCVCSVCATCVQRMCGVRAAVVRRWCTLMGVSPQDIHCAPRGTEFRPRLCQTVPVAPLTVVIDVSRHGNR